MEQPIYPKIDLVKSRLWWYLISIVVIIPGLYFWVTKGLNLGIDFTGGTEIVYKLKESVPDEKRISFISEVRRTLSGLGLAGSEIKLSSETTLRGLRAITVKKNNILYIRTGRAKGKERALELTEVENITKSLKEKTGELKLESHDTVGAVIGADLRRKAITALIIGCLGILIYLSLRFEFRFGVAAIIAMVHDVLVLVGLMALLRAEINSTFVAALLTVVGYSVHDTVVIFDRIRENLKLYRREPFDKVVNFSLIQTMARSINTVLTVEFTLIALFFFGGAAIHSFALALLIGVTSGAYSSIFNAAQIVVSWQRLAERIAPKKEEIRKPIAVTPTPPRPPGPLREAPKLSAEGPERPPAPPIPAAQGQRRGKRKKRKKRRR